MPSHTSSQCLGMAFQFGRDGAPAMECGPKPDPCLKQGMGEDFLWCGPMRGIRRGRPQKGFWKDMKDRAERDSQRWRHVLESMSRFECRVEVKAKPGAFYKCFPPKAGTEKKNRVQCQAQVQSSARGPQTAQAARAAPPGVGKPSRLRNQVKG